MRNVKREPVASQRITFHVSRIIIEDVHPAHIVFLKDS